MEIEQLIGFWILERREEAPIENSEFTIGDKTYNVQEPSLEVLYFESEKDKCSQLGLELLPLEEHGGSTEYTITSFMPGKYDCLANTITILGKSAMSIEDGKLFIKEVSDDYECHEVWARLSLEEENLKKFLDTEFGNK